MIQLIYPNLHDSDIMEHHADITNIDSYVDMILAQMAKESPLDKAVLCYARKEEDLKDYVFRGKLYKHAHSVDFLAKPLGPLDVQELTNRKEIHNAADIRDNPYILHPCMPEPTQHFYVTERAVAAANHRLVGEPQENDRPIISALLPPQGKGRAQFQEQLLKERGHNSLIVVDAPPCSRKH